MTGADWLLDALAAEGIDRLFGNPGSTELPLVDALPRQDRVRYVLGLHEHAVLGMADGHAQASGQLTAVNIHVQPGLANGLAGVLNAQRARVPMLVTVGQQVRELLPSGPFLGGELVAMAAPVAKAAFEVERPEDLPSMVARAIALARTSPQGPVVLSLPMEIQDGATTARPHQTVRVEPPPAADAGSVATIVAVLRSARAPVILAGDGIAHVDAAGWVIGLAERLGAPIHGEPFASRASIPTTARLWAGPLPGFGSEIHARLEEFDVVLALGMPVFRLFGTSPGPALPEGCRLIHIDVDPLEVGRSQPTEIGCVACPGATSRVILQALGPPRSGWSSRGVQWANRIAETRRRTRRAARNDQGAGSISPNAFALAIADSVGPRDLVVEEALTSGRALRGLLDRRPGSWLAHRGSALGWGLPAAVGASLARPDRRVLCLQGDGGVLFGIHALWTAVREGAPVALVVADNAGYAILRAGLEGLTGRSGVNWPGLDTPGIDLVQIARGFGASAARVDDAGSLPDALRDLWRRTADGPAVLVAGVEARAAPVGYPLDS